MLSSRLRLDTIEIAGCGAGVLALNPLALHCLFQGAGAGAVGLSMAANPCMSPLLCFLFGAGWRGVG